MKRSIVKIDREKCNGCGVCIPNCHEGALQIIDEKATLVSELMCDGLGACLGHCPEGAIEIEEREAEDYDEILVIKRLISEGGKNVIIAHLKHLKEHKQFDFLQQAVMYLTTNAYSIPFDVREVISEVHNHNNSSCGHHTHSYNKEHDIHEHHQHFEEQHSHQHSGGCPGSVARSLRKEVKPAVIVANEKAEPEASELINWPVQMHLINPASPHFMKANLMLSADCVAFSLADFHKNYLKGNVLTIACPKLDSNKESYIEKLVSLIKVAGVKSITIMKMEVPCCNGIQQFVEMALAKTGSDIPVKSITVSINGEILKNQDVNILANS